MQEIMIAVDFSYLLIVVQSAVEEETGAGKKAKGSDEEEEEDDEGKEQEAEEEKVRISNYQYDFNILNYFMGFHGLFAFDCYFRRWKKLLWTSTISTWN